MNRAWVKIDGDSSWALLDSGLTIHVVTPGFVEAHYLDIGHMSELANQYPGYQWFGRRILTAIGVCHPKGPGRRSDGRL